MSASSKKKLRAEENNAKLTEKQLAQQKEDKKVKIYTAAFAAVLVILYEARPSLLWQGGVAAGEKQRLTLRGTLGVLAGAAVVVAGGLSLLASAFPDGLEWSLQRLTGSTELETTGPVQAFFARIQEWTALLPDYNFAGSDAAAGTSAAGIIGAVVVLAVVILGVKLVKKAVHRCGSSAQGH